MANCCAWREILRDRCSTIAPRLKIDPDFVTSQVGLGDTYALMGNQEQARIEYDKAIRFAHNEADRLTYTMQKAMTWVRDGKFAEADKLFLEVAETAHAKEQDLQEAQAYRILAEYQTDDNAALKYLQNAEDALGHRSAVSKSDKEEEMSRILRNRTVRAAHAGNSALADKSLQQLEAMASGSRNRVIQSSYNGAAGTLLMDQKKFDEAITHLEEDQDNPFTMELLVQAYYQTNQSDKLARGRGHAARHQCSDHGASASRSRGAPASAGNLEHNLSLGKFGLY